MTWQGVSEAECYDNRSVMAQIMRLKDRVRALEEGGDAEIWEEIDGIKERLETLETQASTLETAVGTLSDEVDAEVARLDGELAALESGKADKTQLSDGSVTKIGTATVGGNNDPIYLQNGTPSVCGANFIKVGPNNIGISEVELTNTGSLSQVGTLKLEKAELRTDCDVYDRRYEGYEAGSTSMWGWEIPIQNEKDNAFEIEIDVIRDGVNGTEGVNYSRFRLVSNGAEIVPDVETDPRTPPTLDLICEFGDPTMLCVARFTAEHWLTDFTIWNVYVKVSSLGSTTNTMPSIRINHVKSKKKIYFNVTPGQYRNQYEDVVYGRNTIPNITNYMYYDWFFPEVQGPADWKTVTTFDETTFNELFEEYADAQSSLLGKEFVAKKEILIYASYKTGNPQALMTAKIEKGQHVTNVALVSSLGYSAETSYEGPIFYVASASIKAILWDGNCQYIGKLVFKRSSSGGYTAGSTTYFASITIDRQTTNPFNPGSNDALRVYVQYR